LELVLFWLLPLLEPLLLLLPVVAMEDVLLEVLLLFALELFQELVLPLELLEDELVLLPPYDEMALEEELLLLLP
jgi:hypothetical protein